ncbi:hypothetical protein [Pseudomonas phage vB_PaeM_RP7]|uniref:Uncharacterized protein n=2 Tax=Nankokuvirus TaxID=1925779 RepID=V5JW33_9CAUD|nr:hypothetical protein X837_gp057 [Pseudomonas phage CHA_P1]QEM40982.1 hypothetical protein PAPJP_056 [Pseudomonas phage PAP-JP]UKH48089.1 MAG: hypothetical protein [Pseudomonas phage RP4]WAB56811.1 hypothetical protein [Pseudomonas phage vB_PaeM_RP15]WAB56925.1 hypothetical protein [Pseudomonas phage vB_PaeM_RP6]WAB57166.1 hypothetical protein [Pseudomonas phage vB_PaeM_RP7]WAB57303.1 hypothetical protein [Pseudomonas phage vB_PaeM_RP8]WAB57436.1 hypothetical protein [Pseudomonas phage vB_
MENYNDEREGQMTEKELFDRLVTLHREKLTNAEDRSQLKKDAKEHGLDKDRIKLIDKAAAHDAKRDFEEKDYEFSQLRQVYEELSEDA